MNILFFLTPKKEVAFVPENCTLRQALEKLDHYHYTALPILNERGMYVGTLTEGDLLRYIKDHASLNLRSAEDVPIKKVPRRWYYKPVHVGCTMEELVETSLQQNFVPVIDDCDVFIGIIPRRHIIQHFYQQLPKQPDVPLTTPQTIPERASV
jgi:CBS domain-containing protein